ncbi:hypothetical protein [Jiella marina]|uniref:hypothetical protein n=1 Tax=Jiella sp. LLJ827 TaxID=2917712 RepID=UPI002101138B|nr:hypothetical protein [Jiella sp. LLJ827]MCQ0990147.1 hypothetical protein [Jiella sp. LLJ827]
MSSGNSAVEVIKSGLKVTSSPIPSAEQLRAYEEISTGMASEIVGMAQVEQSSYIFGRDDKRRRDDRYRLAGLFCGLIAFAAMLFLVAFLARLGSDSVALAVCGFGIATIVSSFIVGNKLKNNKSIEN